MQAVVKTPHIEITIRGDIPPKLLSLLREEYGETMRLIEDTEEELVNVFESDWYKGIKENITPGDNMKIYRELHGWTQKELGEKLGGIPRQHISNMERGLRAISLRTARKLAKIFDVPIEKFL